MARGLTGRCGAAWTQFLAGVAVLALMVLIAAPGVERQTREEQRRQVVRQLTRISMAKEAYTVEHDLLDGAVVQLDQLLVDNPYLEQEPVFMIPGQLVLRPIGQVPAFELPDGEMIEPLPRTGIRY